MGNNPVNFNDPSGHMRIDGGTGGASYTPPPPTPKPWHKPEPKGDLDELKKSDMPTSHSWTSTVPDVVWEFLGDARTPIAMDAIQVLTGRIITVSLAAAAVPGAGEVALGIFALAYVANRAAATIGFAATAYQAGQNLNGTSSLDVTVSGAAWVGGFLFPALSEDIAIFALFYDSKNYILSNQ